MASLKASSSWKPPLTFPPAPVPPLSFLWHTFGCALHQETAFQYGLWGPPWCTLTPGWVYMAWVAPLSSSPNPALILGRFHPATQFCPFGVLGQSCL